MKTWSATNRRIFALTRIFKGHPADKKVAAPAKKCEQNASFRQSLGVRLSAQKVIGRSDLIRGKKVDHALNILAFTPKKGATIIKKVLESAIANAEHNLQPISTS